MTREELQEKISALSETINIAKFERKYRLSEKILLDLFSTKAFGEKRISKVMKALEQYKKDIEKII